MSQVETSNFSNKLYAWVELYRLVCRIQKFNIDVFLFLKVFTFNLFFSYVARWNKNLNRK